MAADSLTTAIRRSGDLRFVVLGAYVADCFVATSRLPAWGVEYGADSVHFSPGGKGLNQAVALARLGAHVTAIGIVGGDALGQDILSTLTREGVEVESMLMREHAVTLVCVCFVSQKGETCFVPHIADDVAVTSDRVRAAEAVIQQADAVLTTFELPLASICEAIALASRCEALVFLQPAPPLADLSGCAIIPWNQVHVLVPNKTEALAILHGVGSDRTNQMDDLAAGLAAELTAPAVVVTLGESGCIAYADGSSRRYPAHPAVPVDTTGASDAFIACLAAFTLAGGSEADAIEAALAAAAWTIGRPGGHQAMPSLAQLIGKLSQPR